MIVRLLALAAGAVVVALAAPVAALDAGRHLQGAEVAVRAAAHPGFGRLVLEWPHAVEVALAEAPGSATLTFSSRLRADLRPARASLAPWLRAVEDGDDGRALRLALAPGVRARLSHYRPELVVLDLAHPGADEGPVVALRTGRHDGFVRQVFDWGEGVGFVAEQSGRELTLTFARRGRVDGVELGRRLRPWIEEASAQHVDGGTRVRLRLARGIEARTFAVEGRQVVVDLHLPADTTAGSAADDGRAPEVAEADAPARALPPPPKPPVQELAAATEPAESVTAPEINSPAPQDNPLAAAADDGAGPTLHIGWQRPVAAAAFVRGGFLWLVFDAAAGEALGPLPPPVGPALAARLWPGERINTASGTALRFPLREPVAVAAARAGATWRFTLGDDAPPPVAVSQRRLAAPARLQLEAGGGGELVRLPDPDVGDQLTVWPLLEAGRGQPQRRLLVDLELLASAQGVIWRPVTDRLEVRRMEQGIEFGAAAGLLLSRSPATPSLPASEPERASAPRALAPLDAERPTAVLGLGAWALGSGDVLTARRAALMRQVAAASGEQREKAELDLARLFLGQAMAAEALAVLEDAGEGAGAAKLARRALIGAAAVLAGQLELAADALASADFDHEPEIALWRAALAAAQRDWPRAARELERAGATLDGYPPPLQMQLGVPAAMIAIEDGRPEIALAMIERLAARSPSAAEQARLTFVRGLAEARIGAVEHAALLWRSLERPPVPGEIRVEAAQSRNRLLLDAGRIAPEEALTHLRSARPMWHGHPSEGAMLDALAEVHLRTGDAVAAIRTWGEVLRLERRPQERERVRATMRETFARAVVEGDSGPLAAVRALALYRDLPELLPPGAAGAELRRRLARQLASVDLVEPAGALLEEELLHGEGTPIERARDGLELAALRLEGPDPQAALAALEATAGPALPPPLAAERELAQARALLALERPQAALAALAGRDDAAALQLRASAHWSSGDWSGAIAALEALLGEWPGNGAPLGRDEEELVLRLAVANARLGRAAALDRLRERFGAAVRGRESEPAFLLATSANRHRARPEAALAVLDARLDELRGWLQRP